MESEVDHRIKARHVYENELRRHAVSTKKKHISIDDMSTLPIEDSVETGTSG